MKLQNCGDNVRRFRSTSRRLHFSAMKTRVSFAPSVCSFGILVSLLVLYGEGQIASAQQPVPPQAATFEVSGAGGGYVTGTVHGQNGWAVDLGSAIVEPGTGFGGTRGLKVEAASPFSQARLTLGAPTPAQSVMFFDFQVKGIATVATQDAQREEFLDVDGALLGLFRTGSAATTAEIFVFDGDGSGGGAWLGPGKR